MAAKEEYLYFQSYITVVECAAYYQCFYVFGMAPFQLYPHFCHLLLLLMRPFPLTQVKVSRTTTPLILLPIPQSITRTPPLPCPSPLLLPHLVTGATQRPDLTNTHSSRLQVRTMILLSRYTYDITITKTTTFQANPS